MISGRYIYVLLRFVPLFFIRALQNSMLMQDNAQLPHVAGIVRTFLHTEIVRLLPCPQGSQVFSPLKNFWLMSAKSLTRHHMPVTIADELRNLVQVVLPVDAI